MEAKIKPQEFKKEPILNRQKQFPNRRICTLIITHKCNLNCTYCYESFKNDAYMDIDLAKNILLKELSFVQKSDKFKELEIDFMGGEPFLNFKLIKEVVEWMNNLESNIPFVFSCSTNGTLLDNAKKEWLIEHKNIFIPSLSYDGDYHIQEINRGVTINPIDLQFFIDTWPEQAIHVTISKETLPYLAKCITSLQYKGAKVEAALAQGINWTIEDAKIFEQQLRILKEIYLENENIHPINLLSRPLFGISKDTSKKQKKFCGTGTSIIAYDVDGKSYPCHMFTPLVLGPQKSLEFNKAKIKDDDDFSDPFCNNCIFKNWCPTCYGFNYYSRGKIYLRDHSWCKMIKAQAVVSCEFQISYYNKHIHSISKKDISQLKAAINAYKTINNI